MKFFHPPRPEVDLDHIPDPDNATADEILAMDRKLIDLKAKRVFWVRLAVVLLVLIPSLCLAVIVWAVFSVRQTQLDGTPTGKKLVASSDQIISCTTPKGKCYKDGQKNQAAILAAVSDNVAITVVCGVNLVRENPKVTLADVRTCVTNLTEQNKKP